MRRHRRSSWGAGLMPGPALVVLLSGAWGRSPPSASSTCLTAAFRRRASSASRCRPPASSWCRASRSASERSPGPNTHLIPIYVLVVKLVAAEIDDGDERHFDIFSRRLHPAHNPPDLVVVTRPSPPSHPPP